jgi:hypothetical protein
MMLFYILEDTIRAQPKAKCVHTEHRRRPASSRNISNDEAINAKTGHMPPNPRIDFE